MKKILLILALAVTPLFAQTVSPTNAEALRLFAALRSVQPGLTATNARNVSIDVNLLRPIAEAAEAGSAAADFQFAQALAQISDADPLRDVKKLEARKVRETFNSLPAMGADGKRAALTLVPVDLSEKEQFEAKLTADAAAEILRWLTPAKK